MNKYRTHNCNELRKDLVGENVTLSGWINKKRDHGNLLFLDLRDNYGVTQCIIDKENSNFRNLHDTIYSHFKRHFLAYFRIDLNLYMPV